MCGWQVKLCDPLQHTGVISERFRDRLECYRNGLFTLLFTLDRWNRMESYVEMCGDGSEIGWACGWV